MQKKSLRNSPRACLTKIVGLNFLKKFFLAEEAVLHTPNEQSVVQKKRMEQSGKGCNEADEVARALNHS